MFFSSPHSRPVKNSSDLQLLVLRFSSLGDVILLGGLLTALQSYVAGVVELVTTAPFDSLWDQAVGLKRRQSLFHFLREFHRKKPVGGKKRVLLDAHATLRSLCLRLFFFWLPRLTVDKRTFERSLLCTLKIDTLSWPILWRKPQRMGFPLVYRLQRDLIGAFTLVPKEKLFPTRLTATWVNGEYPFSHLPFVLVVPSASHVEKRWEVANFIQFLKMSIENGPPHLNYVITAGEADSFCRAFDVLVQKYPKRLFNLQGKTSLAQTAALAKDAVLCIGNDTGVPHMAESLGTDTLVILGPTGESFGFAPYRPQSRVISNNIWCRPCTTNGKGMCIRSERFCLTEITPERVFSEMLAYFARNPLPKAKNYD